MEPVEPAHARRLERAHDGAARQAARRLPSAEGEGSGRDWPERHLLLATDRRRAAVLARRFRQNAIVVVRVGAPARLALLRGARVRD